MKKLLFTGISGFLGLNLCQVVPDEWKLYGTYHNNPVEHENLSDTFALNLTERQQIRSLLHDLSPDAVIHAAGRTRPDDCQQNPRQSEEVNIWGTACLTRCCADQNIPLLFTSTDQVFEGEKGNYRESDAPAPLNRYGEQKWIAEQLIQGIYPQATICRMPLMFGKPGPASGNFFVDFYQKMKKGKALGLFTDEYRTPVSGKTAAQGLLLLLEKEVNGLFHLGGPERINRYEFGQLIKKVFELSEANLKAIQSSDIERDAPRPSDVSMNSSKAGSLGYHPPPLKDQIKKVKINSL